MRAVRDSPAPRPKVETGHRDRERKGRGSLDARSLAQPCYLPKKDHRPPEGESEDEIESRTKIYSYLLHLVIKPLMTRDQETRLRRPRQEAEEKLRRQISKGQLLEDQATEAPDQFRFEVKAWLDYNVQLLKDLFTTDQVLKDYRRSEFARTDFDVFADQYQIEIDELRDGVRDKLPRLSSLLSRLEFFQESNESGSIELDVFMKIPNNKQMEIDLPKRYSEAKEAGKPLTLLMIDVDDLKKINETVGHPNANTALLSIAQKIKQCLEGKGAVYRYAGDELLAVLPNFDTKEAQPVAQRLRKEVELLSHAPLEVRSTITIGVASYPDPISNLEDLQKEADKALMKAKRTGKNKVLCCG